MLQRHVQHESLIKVKYHKDSFYQPKVLPSVSMFTSNTASLYGWDAEKEIMLCIFFKQAINKSMQVEHIELKTHVNNPPDELCISVRTKWVSAYLLSRGRLYSSHTQTFAWRGEKASPQLSALCLGILGPRAPFFWFWLPDERGEHIRPIIYCMYLLKGWGGGGPAAVTCGAVATSVWALARTSCVEIAAVVVGDSFGIDGSFASL